MSNFSIGDKVMFRATIYKVDTYSKFTELDLRQPQTVLNVSEDSCLLLAEDDGEWPSGLWEHVEEWAKHQQKVDTPTELELAKVQIKALQDLKFDTQQAVEDLFCAIRDGADKEWLLDFMKQYPFNVEAQ